MSRTSNRSEENSLKILFFPVSNSDLNITGEGGNGLLSEKIPDLRPGHNSAKVLYWIKD